MALIDELAGRISIAQPAPAGRPIARAAGMATPRIGMVEQPMGYANGGLIGDEMDDSDASLVERLALQQARSSAPNMAAAIDRFGYYQPADTNTVSSLLGESMFNQRGRSAIDGIFSRYANGGLIGDPMDDRMLPMSIGEVARNAPVTRIASLDSQQGMIPTPSNPNPVQQTPRRIADTAAMDRFMPPPDIGPIPMIARTTVAQEPAAPKEPAPAPRYDDTLRTAEMGRLQGQAGGEIARPAQSSAPAAPTPQQEFDSVQSELKNSPIAFTAFGGVNQASYKDGRNVALQPGQEPADVKQFNALHARSDGLATQMGMQPVGVIEGANVIVDGVKVPFNVAEAGGKMLQDYVAAAQQGAQDRLNPVDAKARVEQAKSAADHTSRMEVANLNADVAKRGQDMTDARQRDLTEVQRGNKQADELDRKVTRFSQELEKTNVPQFEALLSDIEAEIAKYAGKDVPGYGATGMLPQFMLTKEGQQLRQKVSTLQNLTLKERSGAAVTNQELQRFLNELGTGMLSNDDQLRNGLKNIRSNFNAVKQNAMAGVGDDVLNEYMSRGGMQLSRGAKTTPAAGSPAPANTLPATKTFQFGGTNTEARLAPDGKYYIKQPNGKYVVVSE